MSTKNKLGWMLLSGASLAAMGAFSPALAQDEGVEDEIVVTATGRAAAIQDVPLAVTAISGAQLENSGVQDLRDVTQVAPSLQMGTGQSNSSGTIARIRGIGTGSDNPGFEGAVGIFIDGVYRARAGAALADLPELERVEVLRGPQGTLFGRNTSAGAISVVTAGPDYDPGLNMEVLYGFDDLEEAGLSGGVNVPLSDTLAFRVDGSVRSREGYITDLISGDDLNNRGRWSARGQAQWDISSNASLRIIVDGAESDEVCCGITPLVYGPAQAVITALTAGAGTPAIDVEGRAMTVTPGRGYGERTEDFGVSAELNWDIGGINLTSITAVRDWEAARDQDIDFNVIDIAYRDGLTVAFENFTQEIRLQGQAGPVDWLVGVFYGDEKLDSTDTIRIGANTNLYSNILTLNSTNVVPFPAGGCELYNFTPQPSVFQCAVGLLPGALQAAYGATVAGINAGHILPNATGAGQQADVWNVDTQSLSLFTHNEIDLSDNMVLTIGARYNQDEKDLNADLLATSASCTSLQAMEAGTDAITPLAPGIVSVILASPLAQLMNLACNPAVNPIANGNWTDNATEEEISGTASLAYHMSEDVMLYGGYSRGYKAGGFNVDRSGFSLTPATVSVGALSTAQLHFDPEFTDAYEVGLKSTIFGSTTVNIAGFYQQIHDYQLNAFNGFNFITRNVPEVVSQGAELEISTRPMDRLNITGGIVYTDAYYDSTVVFNTTTPAGNTITTGDPLAFAPELTVTGSITYEMPLGADLRALFYLDGRWQSEYRTQTLNRDPLGRTDNDGYAILNGRIGIGPENDRWSIEFWGQNLTDEYYHIGAFVPPLQNGTFVVYPNEPQTYGLTLRARY